MRVSINHELETKWLRSVCCCCCSCELFSSLLFFIFLWLKNVGIKKCRFLLSVGVPVSGRPGHRKKDQTKEHHPEGARGTGTTVQKEDGGTTTVLCLPLLSPSLRLFGGGKILAIQKEYNSCFCNDALMGNPASATEKGQKHTLRLPL